MARTTICSLALLATVVCAGQDPPPSRTFDFHSGFWMNLHHLLYRQATTSDPPTVDSPTWRAAIEFYRASVVPRDLLTQESARINLVLSQREESADLQDSGLPGDLIAILESVSNVYRNGLWREHDRANRAWIAAAAPLLRQHEAAMRDALSRVYGMPWPEAPMRTDVTAYAGRVGAYTNLGPAHIAISSTDPGYQGTAALEMLFHEASHAMDENMRTALTAEVRKQGKLFRRRDIWHAILFFTAGELVRQRIEGYEPYAIKNGLYVNGWDDLPRILAADWLPYMNGEITLTASAQRLVASFGITLEDLNR